jgi:hypothetical protein
MSIEPPERIRRNLKQDDQGRYVPWFVAWVDGKPDFRIVDARRTNEAIRFRKCFICGDPLGRFMTFPLGPMCTITRTSPEPPSHRECVIYSASVCPFLLNPIRRRREKDMPEGAQDPAGMMIKRNPGVLALWTTRSYKLFPDQQGRPLIEVGEPENVQWIAEGRAATLTEIASSFDSGCPALRTLAEEEGPKAVAQYEQQLQRAMAYFPKTAPAVAAAEGVAP